MTSSLQGSTVLCSLLPLTAEPRGIYFNLIWSQSSRGSDARKQQHSPANLTSCAVSAVFRDLENWLKKKKKKEKTPMVVKERYDFPMILFLRLLYYLIMRARTHRRNQTSEVVIRIVLFTLRRKVRSTCTLWFIFLWELIKQNSRIWKGKWSIRPL